MSISETIEEELVRLPNGNLLTREEFQKRFDMEVTAALEREHGREEIPGMYILSDGEAYTPAQVDYLLEGIAASSFMKKKDQPTVRKIRKALQRGEHLTGEQLETANSLLTELAPLALDRLDGAVIHSSYNNGSRSSVEQVIRKTLSLSGAHRVMASDVRTMYTRFFDRSTGTLRPEVEAQLPARCARGIQELTAFFQEVTPGHNIVDIGYAVLSDPAQR